MLPHSLRISPPDWLGPLPLTLFHPRPHAPLELDLGCGKGRFLLARAAQNPTADFLGVDRMLRRIRKIDNRARRIPLPNIRLLRAEATYTLAYLLPPASIDTLWILFPDPWPKARHESHRLLQPPLMTALHRILKPTAHLHFATDHTPYARAVQRIFSADPAFTPLPPFLPTPDQQTDFERFYIQTRPITRLSYRHAPPPPPNPGLATLHTLG